MKYIETRSGLVTADKAGIDGASTGMRDMSLLFGSPHSVPTS